MPRYPHLFLPGPTDTRPFTSPQKGGGVKQKARDRASHAQLLQHQLEESLAEDRARRVAAMSDRNGTYLSFVSEPGFDLKLSSLEAKKLGIKLLNVETTKSGGSCTTRASVYVPQKASSHFLKKITQYAERDQRRGAEPKPMNGALVQNIAAIRQAVLEEGFWTDVRTHLPGEDPEWVEVWLSSPEEQSRIEFLQLCSWLNIQAGEDFLTFPERAVTLIRANRSQLGQLVEHSACIAEFRATRELATFFVSEPNRDQVNWVENLLNRLAIDNQNDVSVLILDRGVNNGHRLLQPLLSDDDRHAVHPDWGRNDHHGHGTLMAGLAGYGDLQRALEDMGTVRATHCLESAKIQPRVELDDNPRRLWGLRTADGISLAEIQAPQRKRIICMALSSNEIPCLGRPSSWSGELDKLASGADDNKQRLIIVAGGNIQDDADWRCYPESNKTVEVHEPAQAWNVLSVGAFTNLTRITDATLVGWRPLAEAGGLSPTSSTSLVWERKWPIKPEVLFEGGNVITNELNDVDQHDDVSLLSTSHKPQVQQFTTFGETSAASAQAAWMAAKIQAAYPEAWPETIRALIVHTAEWTDAQRRTFLSDESKGSYARLARVCGYGVPNLERALYCASNSLTLISQSVLQPFDKHETASRLITKDMHLYDLPWPYDVLRDLGEVPVQMRVTLSYFIEPSPGEVGWQGRYRYASHALRFELNGPGESDQEFSRRVNARERDGENHYRTEGANDHWTLGEARDVGSIHSDIWKGSAVDLSASNRLIVHPVVGWWRERPHLGRWDRSTRYALIVSIHLPGQDVDIYTPVAIKLDNRIPVPVEIPVV